MLDASSGPSLSSLVIVVGLPVGIANASISLTFPAGNLSFKMFLKTMWRKK